LKKGQLTIEECYGIKIKKYPKRTRDVKTGNFRRTSIGPYWNEMLSHFTIQKIMHPESNLDKTAAERVLHNKNPNRIARSGKDDMGLTHSIRLNDSSCQLPLEWRFGQKKLNQTFLKLTRQKEPSFFYHHLFICSDLWMKPNYFKLFRFGEISPSNYLPKRKGDKNRLDFLITSIPLIYSFDELNENLFRYFTK